MLKRRLTEEERTERERSRKRARRANPVHRERDNQRRRQTYRERRQQNDDPRSTVIRNFRKKIEEGPTHVCVCCGCLWFKSQTSKIKKIKVNVDDTTFVDSLFVDSDQIQCLQS
ncbi:hypothetical protein BD560DRAFT_439310 [Blakeslea trispora]|nr:hypothetical protein BD560DRAFT_439310 [Blakeslea trispora]